jgi:hypothetical protein
MDLRVALPAVTSCEARENCEWKGMETEFTESSVYLLGLEACFWLRSWFLCLACVGTETFELTLACEESQVSVSVLPGRRKAQRRCPGNEIVQLRLLVQWQSLINPSQKGGKSSSTAKWFDPVPEPTFFTTIIHMRIGPDRRDFRTICTCSNGIKVEQN